MTETPLAVPAPPRPNMRPQNPRLSPGPTTKFPGWSLDHLAGALIGRSHRSDVSVSRMRELTDRTRAILGIPDDYLIGILPGSDTGAFEAAMWSLLSEDRGVEVLAWESFGKEWVIDVLRELKIENARALEAPFGDLPDLASVDFSRDVVFTWNGTTSGVRVPDGDWIPDDRAGLTLCDATSAAFGMELPWSKFDVVTYSWQKIMGGEAQHGMLVIGPRAVARLNTHTPAWPVPKLFRLQADGKINAGIFDAATINTPSMLAIEDHLAALKWAEGIGGRAALFARADANIKAMADWVARTDWVAFLCNDARNQSQTSGCIRFDDAWAKALPEAGQRALAARMIALLDAEGAAYDIAAYPKAPPGLRLWTGGTVETSDLEAAFPWLDWAFAVAKAEMQAA